MKKTLLILFLLFLLLAVTLGIEKFHRNSSQHRAETIEQALITAAIQCYAIEGAYPPNLHYLKEHYGMILDEETYYYHYEAIASNLLPTIRVYRR